MKHLDFILSIYSFIYLFSFFFFSFLFFFLGGGAGGRRQKCKFPHLAKYQNGGGVLNLRQEKCDKSLNLLPILIYKVFFMEPQTP